MKPITIVLFAATAAFAQTAKSRMPVPTQRKSRMRGAPVPCSHQRRNAARLAVDDAIVVVEPVERHIERASLQRRRLLNPWRKSQDLS
jgi:hypothetical protein